MKAWDFSGDEAFILMVSAAIAVPGTARFLHRLARADLFRPRVAQRISMMVAAIGCALFMALAIWNWSDPFYVAGHLDYFTLFMLSGVAGLVGSLWVAKWLGADWWRDGVIAGNPAVLIVCISAMIGWVVIYVGANYGCGPTVETTLFPAMATVIWLVMSWTILDAILSFSISEAIAIDRDQATALRLSGCIIASAIVLARACAGDWWSWENTWDDLVKYGWPIVPMFFSVGVLQLSWKPTISEPVRDRKKFGVAPAIALAILAMWWVIMLPRPEIGKHVVTWEQYTGEKE